MAPSAAGSFQEAGEAGKLKALKYFLILVFTFLSAGCFFQVGENATVLIEDKDLFDRKKKLTKSIGIEMSGGRFHPILPKGTRTPSADALVFQPTSSESEGIEIRIYIGLSESVKENRLLGAYQIKDLPAVGDSKIQLVLAAKEGKIFAEAIELSTDRVLHISKSGAENGEKSPKK